MRFVDEFRDAELGQVLAGEILATVEPGRHYKLMEVCGGHTHSIYKYGVDDLLPANVELVHGPGCPVCVIPMGRVDDGIAVANEPGVIFTCFGDMMRVPGSLGTLLEAKARGADVRMVYSPLDALRIARARTRTARSSSSRSASRPPRRRTALTLKRAKAEGIRNFSCMCSHVTIVPPLRALLDSPDLRLDGFIGPGHVSTVVGARPFEFIPATYGKPVVIAGFEPLDILQAVQMILVQLREGRCEVENQYKRVVPYEGNQRALEVMAEVFALRPHFEWRGLGFISHSGSEADRRLRRLRRRAALQRPRHPRRRPQGLPVRRGPQGRHQAVRVQGVRHRVHAGAADRHVHGELRGRLRGLLQLRTVRAGAGSGLSVLRLGARAASPGDHRDRPGQAREVPRRAHHDGPRRRRPATRSLVEGLLAPAFGIETLDDAAAIGDLALTTDAFVVKPLRFPGGSIGELAVNGTVNDLAMGGAKPLALTLSLILEEGLDADVLRAEVDAIARAAEAAGVRIVGGDTKVVERGHADGMYITTTGLGRRDPRAAFEPARPGDRILLSGPIAAHGTAIMLARGEFELDSDEIVSDTRSLWPAVDAILGPGVRQLRDATRGGVASRPERARARLRRRDARRGGGGPGRARGRRRLRAARHRPDVRRQRGRLRRDRRPARSPGFADIGEIKTEPPGMVLVTTSFGGKRVMDELVGDPLPRIC